MADLATEIQQIVASANADVRVNENFDQVSPVATYARNIAITTTVFEWGVQGGRWGGTVHNSFVITLNPNVNTYIVVDKATGIVSWSETNTNWLDTTNYYHTYIVETITTGISNYEDHRGGPNGVYGGSNALPTGLAYTTSANVFTNVQTVTPISLGTASTITLTSVASNNCTVVLSANTTFSNPTVVTDGTVYNIKIKQDATGGRTLTFGSKFKFPGGTAPVLSTGANAIDFMSCYYDATDDIMLCNFQKGYA
jgi:hypothetical protein